MVLFFQSSQLKLPGQSSLEVGPRDCIISKVLRRSLFLRSCYLKLSKKKCPVCTKVAVKSLGTTAVF